MANTTPVQIRIDKDLKAAAMRYAKDHGISLTDFVVRQLLTELWQAGYIKPLAGEDTSDV